MTSEFNELDDLIADHANDDAENDSDSEDNVLHETALEKIRSRYEALDVLSVLQKYKIS